MPSAASAEGAPIKREIYHTLDGMRGIAALLVALRHGGGAFAPISFAASFLAVDLFFVMSGVVVAQAYEPKLRDGSLSFGSFAAIRVIRLWPLYLLGLALAVLGIGLGWLEPHFSLGELTAAAACAALMLPSPLGGNLFPLVIPAWSLFYEVVANILYGAGIRILTTPMLIAIMAAGSVGCVAAAVRQHSLDAGWFVGDIWIGLARVSYSFALGILFYRLRPRLPFRVPASLCLIAAAALLMVPERIGYRPIFQLGTVLVLFPTLVVLAMNSVSSGLLRTLCRWLGIASYAVYVLHYPLLAILRHIFPSIAPPLNGLLMLAIVIAAALALDRWYDVPIRRILSRQLTARRARAIALRSAEAESHFSR